VEVAKLVNRLLYDNVSLANVRLTDDVKRIVNMMDAVLLYGTKYNSNKNEGLRGILETYMKVLNGSWKLPEKYEEQSKTANQQNKAKLNKLSNESGEIFTHKGRTYYRGVILPDKSKLSGILNGVTKSYTSLTSDPAVAYLFATRKMEAGDKCSTKNAYIIKYIVPDGIRVLDTSKIKDVEDHDWMEEYILNKGLRVSPVNNNNVVEYEPSKNYNKLKIETCGKVPVFTVMVS